MTHDEMIAAIEADKEHVIQSRAKGTMVWYDDPAPTWNFESREYRQKLTPLELWVNMYAGVQFGNAYCSPTEAAANRSRGGRTVHMREVEE